MKNIFYYFFFLFFISANCSQKKTAGDGSGTVSPPVKSDIEYWITKGDQSVLLQKQTAILAFVNNNNTYQSIEVLPENTYQSIDGFGFTLTGASASLINKLSGTEKNSLLQELFGKADNSIGVSYLRISIGASDLSESVFSYDDLLPGETDEQLQHFSLANDTVDVIPVLKQILTINPAIKILGSPWSAPIWMKDNLSSIGGSLNPKYYSVYAKYFVKYIEQMALRGIKIDAITIQNEPMYGGNNPSMIMYSSQQAEFIKNYLGPEFRSAGLTTKIIIWDHNCDNSGYPISILNDTTAKAFIDGSAFHLYGGDIGALSVVKAAHPDKNLYFTEQWTAKNGSFSGDLRWHMKNVVIGSMRNWSRIALEWNLANDPNYSMHTQGGCTECKGALTISSSVLSRNVGYYIIAHASKFVPAGSVRISSNNIGSFNSAAFLTPDGKYVLIVVNDSDNGANFNIKFNGRYALTSLAGGSVGTYIW